MLRLLVNIRGCNGAGKSTIPMAMMDDPKLKVVSVRGDDKAPYITIFPSYDWVALGTYYNKTGGMDTFKNNEATQEALRYAWTNYPEYDVLMEGVIASTIKSTYAELFHEYELDMKRRKVNPRKILIISLLPPLEVCLQRVQERNGGKKVDEKGIAGKWRTVERNVAYFKEQGFTSIRLNTAKVKKEEMFLKFLHTCDKYREVEYD